MFLNSSDFSRHYLTWYVRFLNESYDISWFVNVKRDQDGKIQSSVPKMFSESDLILQGILRK